MLKNVAQEKHAPYGLNFGPTGIFLSVEATISRPNPCGVYIGSQDADYPAHEMAPPSLPEEGAPRRDWSSPGRMLLLFCTMCIFIYIDRGMIASNGVNGSPATAPTNSSSSGGGSDGGGGGSGIQGDFGLSLFQDGLLPAAFMVGLLISSPIFAEASKRHNALRLIGLGLAVWTLAVAGCGLAPGFVPLLLCRMAVGVGEASFVALASPFIGALGHGGRRRPAAARALAADLPRAPEQTTTRRPGARPSGSGSSSAASQLATPSGEPGPGGGQRPTPQVTHVAPPYL